MLRLYFATTACIALMAWGCNTRSEGASDDPANATDCRAGTPPCPNGETCIAGPDDQWRCRRGVVPASDAALDCRSPQMACGLAERCGQGPNGAWTCLPDIPPVAPPPETALGVPDAGPTPAPPGRGARPVPPPTVLPVPAQQRIIAFGDVHGDAQAVLAALNLAGVINADLEWIGGDTIVVQVGDQLDRGDDERAILDYFEYLSDAAWAAGGGVYPLVGNHETINVDLDFRYVTPGGWTDFDDIPYDDQDPLIQMYDPAVRGRVAAFRPGGPYARILAGHNAVMVVGDTLFAHGGVLPVHLAMGLDEVNRSIQRWMRGDGPRPAAISGGDSVVWSRHYSRDTDDMDCALLEQVLGALEVRRIVVAHTVQEAGINGVCGGRAFRVDVGLAAAYGGRPQVLEIRGDDVRVIQ